MLNVYTAQNTDYKKGYSYPFGILQCITHHPIHRPRPNLICHEHGCASSGDCRAGIPHCEATMLIGMGGTGVSLSQMKSWNAQTTTKGFKVWVWDPQRIIGH